MIYLIHFDQPFGHARHYLGYCADGKLEERLKRHRSRATRGSNLLWHVTQAGIGWKVVRTWTGDRARERLFKRNGHARRCPVCQAGFRNPASCAT